MKRNEVFPNLSPSQIEKSLKNWRHEEEYSKDLGIEKDKLCFLISKDLFYIESFQWFYPYSGQWNAYCPFRRIKEIEINNLNEILGINIEEC